jgi:polysaccharide export outer membrane protein
MATPSAATVHVGGDVRRPGAYAWFPGMTVRQLVAAAGGLTPKADGGRLEIVREGPDRHPEPKRTLDDLVQAGDSIVLR